MENYGRNIRTIKDEVEKGIIQVKMLPSMLTCGRITQLETNSANIRKNYTNHPVKRRVHITQQCPSPM